MRLNLFKRSAEKLISYSCLQGRDPENEANRDLKGKFAGTFPGIRILGLPLKGLTIVNKVVACMTNQFLRML